MRLHHDRRSASGPFAKQEASKGTHGLEWVERIDDSHAVADAAEGDRGREACEGAADDDKVDREEVWGALRVWSEEGSSTRVSRSLLWAGAPRDAIGTHHDRTGSGRLGYAGVK